MTARSLLALRSLGFAAVTFGLLLALFGIATSIGASMATWASGRLGSRRVIIAARSAYPIAWLLVVLAPRATVGDALLFVSLFLLGLAAGTENANEMGYWQSLTPDEPLGRVNAGRRSVNRTMGALGALIAGIAVGLIGERWTLVAVVLGFAVAALTAALSPPPRDRDEMCRSALHRHSRKTAVRLPRSLNSQLTQDPPHVGRPISASSCVRPHPRQAPR